jgi:hypothetical protein
LLASVIERERKLDLAERSVLDESRDPIAPITLIDRLKSRGIDEYSIRAAIWILIGDGKLKLTPARHLVSR